MKHAIEEFGASRKFRRDAVGGGDHTRPIASLDHHDQIIILAERIEVTLPALLAGFLRREEIVALGAIFEMSGRNRAGQAHEKRAEDEREPRQACHDADERRRRVCESTGSGGSRHRVCASVRTMSSLVL
jgi:hypothetical protein